MSNEETSQVVPAAGPLAWRRPAWTGLGGWVGAGAGSLLPVNERVFSSTRYGVGNVLYVVTGRSVVVIDTTESIPSASASLKVFRDRYLLPVSHIVYTHFHADHIRGAQVFRAPMTEVIAQRGLPDELAALERIRAYRRRADVEQFGSFLRQPPSWMVWGSDAGYVTPSVLFDEECRFDEGDLTFELYHTQGETVDHVMVWVPEVRTVFPGDLFYNSFPMLSSPMKPVRPVLAWADSLDRMRALEPEHMVPSHGPPVSGRDQVEAVLGNYARAIRFVHDETVAGINRGESLEEIRSHVMLPDDLRSLPYLRESYGSVAWAVVGIFQAYTGWYDSNPVHLHPSRRSQLHGALLEASGGPGPVIVRAQAALSQGQDQLALELSDIVLTVRPKNPAAWAIRVEALRSLAADTDNGVAQNIYRTAAKWPALTKVLEAAAPTNESRLHYAGVWVRSPEASSREEVRAGVGGGTRSVVVSGESDESGGGRATRIINGWHDQRMYHEPDESGGGGDATILNAWYDQRMYQGWETELFEGSDFHNYGYWAPGTYGYKQACENLMEVLLAFIPRKTGTILDVACGKGATTRHLLRYYSHRDVTGVNISQKQLQTSRRNAPGVDFVLMDATQLAFRDQPFDNVLCVEAAFHFATRAAFIAEAFRILKPGGRLVLSDILADPSRPPATTLRPLNLLVEPIDYRNLYLDSGFERVEIVDATMECTVGLMKHRIALLRKRLLGGEISLAAFHQGRSGLLNVIRSTRRGYYLLVSAQKGVGSHSGS